MTQELQNIIDARRMVLGTTQEGREWCLKALHPSNPLTDIIGVPDGCPDVSLAQNFNATFTLSPPAGLTATWGFDLIITQHPVIWGYAALWKDADENPSSYVPIVNPSIDGANVNAKQLKFADDIAKYRQLYFGVTGFHNGTATTNQGSVYASQYELPTRVCTQLLVQDTKKVKDDKAADGAPSFAPPCLIDLVEAWPNYIRSATDLETMPNAYSNKAVEGFYMPLEIDESLTQWKQTTDWHIYQGFTASSNWDDSAYKGSGGKPSLTSVAIGDLQAPDPPYMLSDGSLNIYQQAVLPRTETIIGHVAVRGIDKAASYQLVYRVGLEEQAYPGTSLVTFQKLPPVMDRVALDAYRAIRREFKDAFPERFNTWGELWNNIKSIGARVLPALAPALGMIPVVGGGLSVAARAIGGMLNKTTPSISAGHERLVQKGGRDPPSRAAVERAQKMSRAPAPRRKKQPQLMVVGRNALKKAKKKATRRRKKGKRFGPELPHDPNYD